MENITSRDFSHYPKKILKEGTFVITSHKKPLWNIVVTKHNVTTSKVSPLPKVPTNNVTTSPNVTTPVHPFNITPDVPEKLHPKQEIRVTDANENDPAVLAQATHCRFPVCPDPPMNKGYCAKHAKYLCLT